MPEIFTSYYEVMEKKLSLGATSQVSRKACMTSGVGAIQAQIAYQYISSNTSQRRASVDMSKMNWLIDQQKQVLETQELSDKELIQQFNQHLKNQRNTPDIQFRKFEQDYPDDSSDDSDLSDQGQPLKLSLSRAMSEETTKVPTTTKEATKEKTFIDTLSSWFTFQQQLTVPEPIERKEILDYPLLNTDDDSLKSFPILDTIGSWTMAKETSQVLRAIGKLLVAFVSSFFKSTYLILYRKLIQKKRVKDLNYPIFKF